MPWGYQIFFSQVRSTPVAVTTLSALGNAWGLNLVLPGIIIPYWVAPILALGIALLVLLKTLGLWEAHPAANMLLSLAGLLQVGAVIVVSALTDYEIGSGFVPGLGLGSLLTLCCFVALLRLSIRDYRLRTPPKTYTVDDMK